MYGRAPSSPASSEEISESETCGVLLKSSLPEELSLDMIKPACTHVRMPHDDASRCTVHTCTRTVQCMYADPACRTAAQRRILDNDCLFRNQTRPALALCFPKSTSHVWPEMSWQQDQRFLKEENYTLMSRGAIFQILTLFYSW